MRLSLKFIFRTAILFYFFTVLGGCSKEESEPLNLALSDNTAEVPLGRTSSLPIESGNGKYTIRIEDETILNAVYTNDGNTTFGMIVLNGKKKGQTVLSIRDDVTGKTEKVSIKVTDFYLDVVVSSSNHPALTQNMRIFLINNPSKHAYFFSQADAVWSLVQKGSYNFTTELNNGVKTPYLSLTYTSDANGRFTDAALVPASHKFDLLKSKGSFYDLIALYYGVDWDIVTAPQTKSSPISFISIQMKEKGTDYEIQGYVGSDHLPYGVLD